ncbi:MAG: vWA domain-containing protein [Candidatus Merdivicinus sp.]|jgi:Ca-activated chloride channel family protein
MGILNSNKLVDKASIDCADMLKVTLSLTAAPDILENPTDIVLVLDRSGSMAGVPLMNVKLGANTFIDIISETTGGTQDQQIGAGSRMAVVSFAATAIANTQLITSTTELKAAVNSMAAAGSTNHGDAFTKAMQLLTPDSPNAKVIVMFTDGVTTTGLPPAPIAAEARARGIIIYCIGLIGSDGLDVSVLNEWATDPDTSHVAVTPDAADLEELFAELAANISKPGATGIVIEEEVEDDFAIQSIVQSSKGQVYIEDDHRLRWMIDSLGTTQNEGALLEFMIQHTGTTGGLKKVNREITYQDNENNVVVFPSPEVEVSCAVEYCAEPCPLPEEIVMSGCQDILEYQLDNMSLMPSGRLLNLSIKLLHICPDRRVALGIVLSETDGNGEEHPRGFKAVTVPAHHAPGCRDVLVKCIPFVLPEDQNMVDRGDNFCKERRFFARVYANYLDFDDPCIHA